ncbi:hypothetical protein I7X12_10870 [Halosimplex litoreum]|uniref:Uncharacterized protein n=1 Tax=Halosimplex litoreum TaxID=1198301 RepID=A0A7T3KTI3_9EURY|nr:hypothetical protein [Halosimplex litoreum]QPV61272.1 hypothetical protein I7X12_10870 [Halosimplex litoreum]
MSDRTLGRRVGELVAALAAAAAVAVFARRVGPDLSVTVQSALFALAAALALVGAATTRFRQGLIFLYAALVAGATGYAASTHSFGGAGTFAFVVLALVALLGAVYVVEERRYGLRRGEAVAVVVVVAVAGGALVAADLGTSPLSYETTVHASAELPETTEGDGPTPVVVGSATVDNDFRYREQISFPPARACVFDGTNRTDTPVLYGTDGSYFPSSVGGNGRLRANVTILAPQAVVESLSAPVPVERADDCPAESERERIVVVVAE